MEVEKAQALGLQAGVLEGLLRWQSSVCLMTQNLWKSSRSQYEQHLPGMPEKAFD